MKRLIVLVIAIMVMLTGCKTKGAVKLDPKNPVVITVWHYYNGSIMNAFNALVDEFNETVGAEQGIIVEGYGMGNVTDLEAAVLAAASGEVGSQEMPSIFASYADTAYAAEKLGLLADISEYITAEEQELYITSYIEEGRIGENGELRIFPIAKSTEILMLNETDWEPFAREYNLRAEELTTMEKIAEVARQYYEWTDAQTPEEANDGKSFFGRDSQANMFIIASKEYGTEIFEVKNGRAEIRINEEVMRYIWDNYYVPYISGYYTAYGKFRSDDAKVGDILAYVGSTTSAAYFPTEVTTGGNVHEVEAAVLAAPGYGGTERTQVQQGAGMVVTKSSREMEYASVEFLKWFTDEEVNIKFSAISGYMPVKKTANEYEKIVRVLEESGVQAGEITKKTLKTALKEISESSLYTNKAFDGGVSARAVLEHHLQDKAAADREKVEEMVKGGKELKEAVGALNTDEEFRKWQKDMTEKLKEAAGDVS